MQSRPNISTVPMSLIIHVQVLNRLASSYREKTCCSAMRTLRVFLVSAQCTCVQTGANTQTQPKVSPAVNPTNSWSSCSAAVIKMDAASGHASEVRASHVSKNTFPWFFSTCMVLVPPAGDAWGLSHFVNVGILASMEMVVDVTRTSLSSF